VSEDAGGSWVEAYRTDRVDAVAVM
jgi:hypothetical protein